MNLPILLTLFRILAIPFIVIVYSLPYWWAHPVASFLFILAAITDGLDGYFARTMSLTTRFGAFLDPVADKLLVAISLIMVVSYLQSFFIAIPAVIIVGREIVISGLREWMAEIGKRTSVAVSHVGKIKTTFQITALIILLACNNHTPPWFVIVGSIALYLAAGLTLWSMFIYLKVAWPDLSASRAIK